MMVFARKRFGQNFLQDNLVIERIVHAIQAKPQETVIEIGPGRGALTQVLLKQLSKLVVIEIDNDLFDQLQYLPNAERLIAIHSDVLKVDFNQFGDHLKIVGNLPYNISTPLMFHLLQYRSVIHEMVFMLQAEVVERIMALPSSSEYGRLSVMFQYYCDLEKIIDVPPECFQPVPKVMSAVIALKPKKQHEQVAFNCLEYVVSKAFAMRRKTLANNFKGILTAHDWDHIGISNQLRAQDLSIENFVNIAVYLSKFD